MDLGDAGANIFHDDNRFVAENVALAQERAEYLVQVQVGSADPGRRDAHDRVRRIFDLRIGDRVDADVTLAVPGHCLHLRPPDAVGSDRAYPLRSTGTRRVCQIWPSCVGKHGMSALRRCDAPSTAAGTGALAELVSGRIRGLALRGVLTLAKRKQEPQHAETDNGQRTGQYGRPIAEYHIGQQEDGCATAISAKATATRCAPCCTSVARR